jgi:hypothetical protein
MDNPRKRSTFLVLLVACLTFSLVGAAAASAAGPKLTGPKRGAVLALGSQPTFKASDSSRNAKKYRVYMTISTSKKLGQRTHDLRRPKINGDQIGTFTSMKRKGSRFSYKAEKYSFPTWYMNRPGKYYWQAFRIDCRVKGCHVHSKTSSFIVR